MEMEEIKHHYRVTDMLLTAHSVLRDRYNKYALVTDILLLFVSIVLCASTFIDPAISLKLGLGRDTLQIIFGICSIIIFFISLVVQRVDWKQKSERHNQAVDALIRMKNDCRELIKSGDEASKEEVKRQCQICAWTLGTLPKIPDNQFVRLKAIHKRKVELSKLIDENPGCNVFILSIRLFLVSNFKSNPRILKNGGVEHGENSK